MKILGKQFGVEFLARGEYASSEYDGKETDRHIVVQLLSEDDEHWSNKGTPFSSFWIDDLIDVIKQAKIYLDGMPEDENGFGRKFA